MLNENFQNFYSKLNPEQKEAVDTLEGPVIVIAGPGTGKTQVLTLRIANIILKNKSKPEEILALTFTDSGVTAMRKRLIEVLGASAYYVPIYTFHAFCSEVIGEYSDDFPQFFGKGLIDEIRQMQQVEEIINDGSFNLLKPFGDPFMYVPSLVKSFSSLKREGIGPEKFKEIVEDEARGFSIIEDLYHEKGTHKGKMKGKYKDLERNIEKNKELSYAYSEYQARIKELGYDYDEMILSVVSKMESDETFIQKLQEKYKYILADEHQDTNQAQNRVLEFLSSGVSNPNIFVVGDEKQAIYRFQGANLANFLYFHTRFPNSKMITFRENYRSTQSILNASDALISNNSQKITDIFRNFAGAKLTSKRFYNEKKIRVYEFSDIDNESHFIARKINELIRHGTEPYEIAVLYRNNSDALNISQILEKNGIRIKVESDEELFESGEIKSAFDLMKAVLEFGRGEFLARVLHSSFLNIPMLDAYKIFASSSRDIGTILDKLKSKKYLRTLGVSKPKKLNNIYKKLSKWAGLAVTLSAPQMYEILVRESGLLRYVLSRKDRVNRLNRLKYLHQLSKRLAAQSRNYTLKDFMRDLEFIQQKNIPIRIKSPEVVKNAVRLMTAHRSKGLEFDFLFIMGANHGHWGHKHIREIIKLPALAKVLPDADLNATRLDDERRLFYVALTRARRLVYITYSRFGINGRELFPSQFIEEIPQDHRVLGNSALYERSFEKNPQIIFAKRFESVLKNDEEEFLREIFKNKGLSPTALNNYIACPWKYFYNNLLQIPRAKTKHEMYGTAIHAALRDFFNVRLPGNVTFLLERFEHALSREPISESDFNECLKRGSEVLAKYYDNYTGALKKNTINELSIKNVFLEENVRLTGKIDKIEVFGNSGEVNVVDYKTGKRKTRNTLEGGTKNSTGNEKRQLVFYKILLDSIRESLAEKIGFKPVMISGEIDFVEPDKKTDRFYKEKFVISGEDVRQLEDRIHKTANEIMTFAFWTKSCEDKKCEWCELRKSMLD